MKPSAFSSLTPEQQLLGAATLLALGFLTLNLVAPKTLEFLKGAFGMRCYFFIRRSGASISVGSTRLTDDARMRHTHIVGATGSGKSVLLEQLIYHDLSRGYGALIIDPKGDREFYERIRFFCKKIGRADDLTLLSTSNLNESVRWNPCRIGNVSELQSKFYSAAKYEHSFYAKAAELALLEAFRSGVKRCNSELKLSDLLYDLARLSKGGKDDNLKGLYFDMQNLAQGEWAPILGLTDKPGNLREVNLLDLTRKNEILFVDLPTEGKSVQSSRIGALLLQEITLISGLRKRMPWLKSQQPFGVYVDEFDAFATDPFITFLNKGRSSGFMIHMAHQTLSDLERVSPTFKGQLMGNPNIRFIFRLDLAEDAESISRLLGTKTVLRKTFQSKDGMATGISSNREANEFRIHPDAIKGLRIGECVVSIKTEGLLEQVKIPDLKPSRFLNLELPELRSQLPEKISLSEGPEPDAYERLIRGQHLLKEERV